MPRQAWLTPETIPADTICRALLIPDEESIIAAVAGAILPLTYPFNWEQYGAVTPAAIAARMQQMFAETFVSACGAEMQIDLGVHEVNQNTNGGGIVLATDTTIPFNTIGSLSHGNIVLGANIFTVQPGFYHVRMEHVIRLAGGANVFCWADTSDNPGAFHEGTRAVPAGGSPVMLTCEFLWNIDNEETCEFFARSSASQANTAFGNPMNIAGHNELYGQVKFARLSDPI